MYFAIILFIKIVEEHKTKIGILGGGPSALFMYKNLLEIPNSHLLEITIFEKNNALGAGMPYSAIGASLEHITNVSSNEIPYISKTMSEWIKKVPVSILKKYQINSEKFNEYKVLPRLLFGEYLSSQFEELLNLGRKLKVETKVLFNTTVVDIIDKPDINLVSVLTNQENKHDFDHVIICIGHYWPKTYENKVTGYYDSPYPPSKLNNHYNHPVALRGSSLTAIDAIKTLARKCGKFNLDNKGKLKFVLNNDCPDFKIVMHSRNGFLPAVRFHLEDTHLQNTNLLTKEEIIKHKENNDGFLSLDFVFEHNFIRILKSKDSIFYDKIKDYTLEQFVEDMISRRESEPPFSLLLAEYKEAEKSIRTKESIYWKELLGVLSFAMNYPAKYFSAEDMIRLKKYLMPLISTVIAYVPQSSCEEMLALHDAGLLELIETGDENETTISNKNEIIYTYIDSNKEEIATVYQTFIDCIGQPQISYNDFPYKSLINNCVINPAYLRYKDAEIREENYKKDNVNVNKSESGEYYQKFPGLAINDNFQILDTFGVANPRINIMAVPYIGGYNPDYSGLDFCEEASGKIAICFL